jgi:hypothetical protein
LAAGFFAAAFFAGAAFFTTAFFAAGFFAAGFLAAAFFAVAITFLLDQVEKTPLCADAMSTLSSNSPPEGLPRRGAPVR